MEIALSRRIRAGGGVLAAVRLRHPDKEAIARIRDARGPDSRITPADAPALAAPLAWLSMAVLNRLHRRDLARLAVALESMASGSRRRGQRRA